VTTLFGSNGPRRTLLLAEATLLFLGFVCLAWAGYVTAERMLYSSWQDYRFEKALQGENPTLEGYVRYLVRKDAKHPEGEEPTIQTTAPPRKSGRLKSDDLVGRIEIPRVKVSAVVKEGVEPTTLSRAVGHVPSTALPGEAGNVGVAAHRDTFFRGLRNVQKGDTIRVVTLAGVYLYQVEGMKIVWPKDVEVLDPTPKPTLTLVTCYPFNYVGSAPKRFIVQAKQTGFEELTAQGRTRLEQEKRSKKTGS
jgi:sortase A